jgi:hypothetical protein
MALNEVWHSRKGMDLGEVTHVSARARALESHTAQLPGVHWFRTRVTPAHPP